MKTRYFTLLVILFIQACGEIKQPPGILAPAIPKQTKMKQVKTWDKDNYHFTALAKFDLNTLLLNSSNSLRVMPGLLVRLY